MTYQKKTTTLFIFLALFLTLALLLGVTIQPFVSPIFSNPPVVDAQRLQDHVKKLSVDFYPRSFEQTEQINRAAAYIERELRTSGARVSIQKVSIEGASYKNIIASFGPETNTDKTGLLVFGAHYDSHGDELAGARQQRKFSLQTHTPGADDNASGVAGLIELARLLGQSPQNRAIELVAYTTEEPPHFRTEHMGSRWHAKALSQSQRPIKLMMSLEMIGFFRDTPGSQTYPVPGMTSVYPNQANFVAIVGQLRSFSETRRLKAIMAGATTLPVYSINAVPALQGIDFSDHQSYWHEGFAALMITDTSFLRNPNYHQAGDTFDTLDYTRMAQVVQSVYAVSQLF